ncbi:hypothetical protein CLV51_1068 [Chitinophaga niastensis]|uniref:Uncharacterized protein n=1 Tax=Chitinophaga niastensis TaxID=536980 RepID=A0A2P8HD30_CHINA|nr:hypothetical protein CLV51_1068 [Chitinophaga niastensis]
MRLALLYLKYRFSRLNPVNLFAEIIIKFVVYFYFLLEMVLINMAGQASFAHQQVLGSILRQNFKILIKILASQEASKKPKAMNTINLSRELRYMVLHSPMPPYVTKGTTLIYRIFRTLPRLQITSRINFYSFLLTYCF